MKIRLALLFSVCISFAFAQKNPSKIRIAFYNPENIFDTINDTKKNDEEFLPEGKNKWNTNKYEIKLKHTARVVSEINDGKGADIIGFSEIENKSVLVDLTTKTELKKQNYDIVHHDSPDERGIDVGLIYKKDLFSVIESKAYNIRFPFDTTEKTRDILLVKGVVKKNKAKLYILVNHWPSRRGGENESEPKRIFVAERVKQIVDSIAKKENDACFVLMGDLNDTPKNKSILEGLKTVSDSTKTEAGSLFNMMAELEKKGKGTHFYKGERSMLDQFIVSTNLFGGKKLYTYSNSATIFEQDWLMEKHPKTGEIQPFRTFVGNKFIGGYSDHLPVYFDLYVK
ncbi:MAG: hypothetical protein V4667_00440 [Bacteroidota bacterium]